ncbi:hypothetical protein HAX54_040442 [Datura stramonium]|uniref:Uncharacterized protein n=1 Tax=Datura stramonium TaxID=4076 RepID=A0ABS8VRJ2_DATST|nr:hypothetical protein [Datura stramonium]
MQLPLSDKSLASAAMVWKRRITGQPSVQAPILPTTTLFSTSEQSGASWIGTSETPVPHKSKDAKHRFGAGYNQNTLKVKIHKERFRTPYAKCRWQPAKCRIIRKA